jgi:hypothetical protein
MLPAMSFLNPVAIAGMVVLAGSTTNLRSAEGTAWAYYASGFLKAETTVHDGNVLERKVWKDGELRESN